MASLSFVLQQIKIQEEKDSANKKRIKECESVVKAEKSNIKELQALKIKLAEDLEAKLEKNCKLEIDKDIFEQQKQIWSSLLRQTCNELKEEEANLETLQQSVFQNRESYCDEMWDYLNQHDWLRSHGLKNKVPTSTSTIVVKTEADLEYTNLLETANCLEMESNQLDIKLFEIEEAKQLRSKLFSEPSTGEEFLRLQRSIQDINLKVKNLDEQIDTIKKEKKLRFLDKSKQNSLNIKGKNIESALLDACNFTPTIKLVKFNDAVDTKNISSSTTDSDANDNEPSKREIKTQDNADQTSKRVFQRKRSYQEIEELCSQIGLIKK